MSNPAAQPSERRWAWAYFTLYALYIIIGMSARLAGWLHDDALVFVQSARRVVDGSFDIYGIVRTPFIAPPLGTTYPYSSLLVIVLAPFVALTDAFKLGNIWAMKVIALPLLVFDVLAMQQMRRLAREWRPFVDERYLFLGAAMSLFLTSFLWVTGHKSHAEGMVLLFLLLTLRLLPRNVLLAGVCAGLALAAKHMTALLGLIPIGLVFLFGGRASESGTPTPARLKDTLTWGASALGVFALFLLPPVLRNPDAAYYALVTQTARIVPLGPGLPRWANALLGTDPSANPGLREAVLSYSNVVLIAVIVGVTLFMLWQARRATRPIGIQDARLLGLMAFGGIAYIIFAKWVSDHYYQVPLALVFLWDLVRSTPRSGPSSVPWIGIGAAIAYRAVTQIDPLDYSIPLQFNMSWVRDILLLILFIALVLVMLLKMLVVPKEAT
ncbi:MAG TPA: hypothetical protein VEX13_17485 [Chloroflexia bacterium]|nr:hypothetical protein [Chloroflexia bacterium]